MRLDAARPTEVVGDDARLRQVLDNLLANVRAHTPEGTATVVRVSTEDHEAEIDVADAGPGLDPDHADRGALPYHFLQQVLGRTDVAACPARSRRD